MMRLTVIATGSSGNCYVLEAGTQTAESANTASAGGETLLLDAGIPPRGLITISRTVPWSSIVGCLITHEHMDHAKGAPAIALRGIPMVMSQGTKNGIMQAMPNKSNYLQGLSTYPSNTPIRLGGFTILPFGVQHDANEPQGFIIRHGSETLLYATDTYYLKYTFPGINYWLIECNYIDDILNSQLYDESISMDLRHRLKTSHMSLDRLKGVMRANDLVHTREIILCHLSDQRADEERMCREISDLTHIPVSAAAAGMVKELSLTPF